MSSLSLTSMPVFSLKASWVGDFVSLPFMSRYAVQLAHLRIFSESETSFGSSRLAGPPEGGAGGAQPVSASPVPAARPVPRSARRLRPPVAAEARAAAGGDIGCRRRRGIGVISSVLRSALSHTGVVQQGQLSMLAITCLIRV